MHLPLFAASLPTLEDRTVTVVVPAPADPAATSKPQFQNVFADNNQEQAVQLVSDREALLPGLADPVEDGVIPGAGEMAVGPGLVTAIILPAQDNVPKSLLQAKGEDLSARLAGRDVGLFAPVAANSGEETPVLMTRALAAPARETLAPSVGMEPVTQAEEKAPESAGARPQPESSAGHLASHRNLAANARQIADTEAAMAAPGVAGHGKQELPGVPQDPQGPARPEGNRPAVAGTGARALAGSITGGSGQAAEAGGRHDWSAPKSERHPSSTTTPDPKDDRRALPRADIAAADAMTAEPPRRAAPPSLNTEAAFRAKDAMSAGEKVDLPASDPPTRAQTGLVVDENGQSGGVSQAETREKEGSAPTNGPPAAQVTATSPGPAFGVPERVPLAPAPERTPEHALVSADIAEGDQPYADLPVSEPRAAAGASPVPHAPAPMQRPDLTRGMALQIAEVISQSQDRAIELKLHPEELGRVSMTLAQDGGSLTVAVTAERGETLDLMRRNIDLLGEELRRLGYGSVDFTFGGGTAGEGALRRDARPSGQGGETHGMEASDDVASVQARAPAPEPGSGHVDIRL